MLGILTLDRTDKYRWNLTSSRDLDTADLRIFYQCYFYTQTWQDLFILLVFLNLWLHVLNFKNTTSYLFFFFSLFMGQPHVKYYERIIPCSAHDNFMWTGRNYILSELYTWEIIYWVNYIHEELTQVLGSELGFDAQYI